MINEGARAGIFRIDTAPTYGASEKLIGDVLSGDANFWISSKVSPARNLVMNRYTIEESLFRSLKVMKRDRLDCLYLHSLPFELLSDSAVQALLNFKNDGTLGRIGVSSDNLDLSKYLEMNVFDSFMATFNLIDMSNLPTFSRIFENSSHQITIKRALANAVWHSDLKKKLLQIYDAFKYLRFSFDENSYEFRHKTMLRALEGKLDGMDYLRLALFWDVRAFVLIGTRNPNHLKLLRNVELGPPPGDCYLSSIMESWRECNKFGWEALT